jgi:hypothetical protein
MRTTFLTFNFAAHTFLLSSNIFRVNFGFWFWFIPDHDLLIVNKLSYGLCDSSKKIIVS